MQLVNCLPAPDWPTFRILHHALVIHYIQLPNTNEVFSKCTPHHYMFHCVGICHYTCVPHGFTDSSHLTHIASVQTHRSLATETETLSKATAN
jgi:hypothetical protein